MLERSVLSDNLRRVHERIREAALRSGLDAAAVRVMAVTKTFPPAYVQLAREVGMSLFGENRVQEAQAKYGERGPGQEGGTHPGRELPPLSLHLIGHLQRNKARIAARLFDCVQSIDKLQTAQELDRHCAAAGRRMPILLELNTSGEESKFGFESEGELTETLEQIVLLPNLEIRGLMTVGPLTGDSARVRAAFGQLRELYDRLRRQNSALRLDTLSMGMSGDFEVAVEEGATLVRLGTVLFGPRQL